LDRRVVLSARDLAIPTPSLAEVTLQEIEGLPPQIRARLNAKRTHPDCRLWTHAAEFSTLEGSRQNPERLALLSGKPWAGGNLPDRNADPISLAARDTRAQSTDRWCHRPVYSWQIRTALAAALSDPHRSFTILPYGCSGATIMDGAPYGYNGVEWSASTDRGVIGSRSEVGLRTKKSASQTPSVPIARPERLGADGLTRRLRSRNRCAGSMSPPHRRCVAPLCAAGPTMSSNAPPMRC
jgi:hypothetical protein